MCPCPLTSFSPHSSISLTTPVVRCVSSDLNPPPPLNHLWDTLDSTRQASKCKAAAASIMAMGQMGLTRLMEEPVGVGGGSYALEARPGGGGGSLDARERPREVQHSVQSDPAWSTMCSSAQSDAPRVRFTCQVHTQPILLPLPHLILLVISVLFVLMGIFDANYSGEWILGN
jgi:hypothetical protein